MKKRIFAGFLLAAGLFFAGCDFFAPGASGGSAYEPLIVRSTGMNGEQIEIEITTRRTQARAVLTPENGDSYVMRVNGVVTSRGTIMVDNAYIAFYPSNGSQPFFGNYSGGGGGGEASITLYEMPSEGGGPGTGGGSGGGGGGGGGSGGADSVTGVSLNKSATAIAVGDKETLTATVKPSSARTKLVAWSSSDKDVATVDPDGEVTGVTPGTATVTVITADGGKKATCVVTVFTPGVTLSSNSLHLEEYGDSATLTATITVVPPIASPTFQWVSDNTDVATVTLAGSTATVTAVGGGTTYIIVSVYDAVSDKWYQSNRCYINVPFSVDNVTDLNTAITDIKAGGTIALIKLTQAFYDNVNNPGHDYIQVDVEENVNTLVPDTIMNTIPYTIRGLGTETSDPELKVGMWLANDCITLEDVKFEITLTTDDTNKDKGTVPRLPFATSLYKTAVLIGRKDSGNKMGLPVHANAHTYADVQYVNVRNCVINITGSNGGFIAGIWVMARYSNIEGNTVTATGNNTSAVCALGMLRMNDGLVATNNTLTAKYGSGYPTPNTQAGNTWSSPASAIFFNQITERQYAAWRIEDNTLSYGNNSPTSPFPGSCFSFVVNAVEPPDKSTREGVKDMVDHDYGTGESDWVLYPVDNNSSYTKRIVDALIHKNIAAKGDKNGFGAVTLYLENYSDWINEAYTVTAGKISIITYWGYEVDKVGGVFKPAPNYSNGGNPGNRRPNAAGVWANDATDTVFRGQYTP